MSELERMRKTLKRMTEMEKMLKEEWRKVVLMVSTQKAREDRTERGRRKTGSKGERRMLESLQTRKAKKTKAKPKKAKEEVKLTAEEIKP